MARIDETGVSPVRHRAARIEDAWHRWRERRGRKRGLLTTLVPYAGYGADGWVRVLGRVLLAAPSGSPRSRYQNVRGWRSFTSVPLSGVDVVVTIDGVEHHVSSLRGGLIDETITATLEPGWHEITLRPSDGDAVAASVFIVGAGESFGIVSDIDDTVMVTSLPRPFLAAWNTFVLNEHARRAVTGMAVLYERVATSHPGCPVVYLSTGAWNVAPTLTRFLDRNLYPRGPLLLTDWGPTEERWFRSGQEHKRASLERLATEFPAVKWLLVGDDGQHDEELYGEFVDKHPENVAAVAIRQLSVGEAVFAGGRSKSEERAARGGAPWVYAPDGAGLAEQLGDVGLTTGRRSGDER